jgi:hypothetical protein
MDYNKNYRIVFGWLPAQHMKGSGLGMALFTVVSIHCPPDRGSEFHDQGDNVKKEYY